jgi:hypothetical protein
VAGAALGDELLLAVDEVGVAAGRAAAIPWTSPFLIGAES